MRQKHKIIGVIILAICAVGPADAAGSETLDSYNVLWNSQSNNASESMPVGGGDVGLNVWVENNELLFYIGRSGTFDENNQMLKLSRVRIRLKPNPFSKTGQFKQELKLRQGYIYIRGETQGQTQAIIKIWVEVFRPVVHLEIDSDRPVSVTAEYECWRTAARRLPGDCRKSRFGCMSLVGYPGEVTMQADKVQFRDNAVLWYHRNRDDALLFDKEIKQQELQEVRDQIWNPLKNLTFGGRMKAEGMVQAGTSSGRYVNTDFTAWKLQSSSAKKRHKLELYLHTDQAQSIDKWKRDLNLLVAEADRIEKDSFAKHQGWWEQFWQRSHLFINSDNADPNDQAWQIGRNYQLFRYMLGCNAYGNWPTKFNGSFFTYDPAFVPSSRGVKTETPDFRTWGGGSFTAQNQRLVYWPMLKNGDFDMMPSQFEFYRRSLKAAELRTKVYWGHDGCSFTEQLENFGLPCGSIYGWLGSSAMLKRVPSLPIKQKNGKPYLAGAESWRKFQVGEIPELYSVFPYGLYGIGKADLELARYTWSDCLRDRQKNINESWYQGGIFTARLGLTEQAKRVAIFKLTNSRQRFRAFRATDDWAPDHNWLGSGMIGLQEMLMQTVGRKIYLLPAWPKEWNVDFKLRAPYKTVVEGSYKDGKIVNLQVRPKSRAKNVVILESERGEANYVR